MLLPARGRHSAPAPIETTPTTETDTMPTWRKSWGTGPTSAQAQAIFKAKEVEHLTLEQQERWWALAFAELGSDFDHPTTNITPVRRAVAA
ncbi:hypothetical protein AB0I22_06200 [Streptomyces sp. NPDC050610]|uniref:hypothetical protein n=1 Tax=Streptomyces sp. NPDC050610 TaxID=3157097 RepID=UPI0034125E6E